MAPGTTRWILMTAAAAILVMALFPPWQITLRNINDNCGYAFIATPPPRGTRLELPCSVDFTRLLVQWVAVAAVAGIALIISGKVGTKK